MPAQNLHALPSAQIAAKAKLARYS